MDDLSSVDWAPSKPPSAGRQHPPALGNYYPTLRPTPPLPGRSTPSVFPPPASIGQSLNNVPPRSSGSTPANDSFAGLVAFGGQQSTKNLSLQEQQKRLQDERAKQEAEKRRQFDARFGLEAASWDTLGDGRTTPDRITSPPTYTATNEYGGQKLSKIINKPFAGIPAPSSPKSSIDDDNDLFSAFNASASVDRSSHMSPPSQSPSIDGPTTFSTSGASGVSSVVKGLNGSSRDHIEDDDDDPFGLGTDGFIKTPKHDAIVNGKSEEDEDVLGLLGRPVSEFPKPQPRKEKAPEPTSETSLHPQDRAIAELIDMGFAPEKSRIALEATQSGTDVQAAVGWLLNQAHEESRKQNQPQNYQEEDQNAANKSQQSKRTPGRRKSPGDGSAKPAWMREQDPNGASQRRESSRSPANGEKDPSQYAAEIGTKMFKTANSLWKTGTKRLNQAVAEFNSDSDSTQPKWMKEAQKEEGARKPRPPRREPDANDHNRMARKIQQQPVTRPSQPDVTDEALMLEADSRPPPRKSRPKADVPQELSRPPPPSQSRDPQEQSISQPQFMQQRVSRDPKAKLSRQAIEEEASHAYISPARRKKTTTKPPPTDQEPDLLFESSQSSYRPTSTSSRATPAPKAVERPTISVPTRSTPPKRNFPAISPFALQASTKARQEGTLAFKRGDYALATTLYSTGITAVPPTHPLVLPMLTNRALAHLKTGDPKATLADAKSALGLIGPSRGASETVDLSGDEGVKPMITYWEKAMTRQAEALEQLERWSEAAIVWKACVEAGVGGATSIAGRNRCEKAVVVPSQAKHATTRKPAAPKPRPKVSALGDLAPESAQSTEAVSRLRAANAAADRVDDEKFALADVVDLRVRKWRLGKESNLRALLSTLQNVLWEGSGWKEIGMGDLLMPGKVKINYMKGIAKVHPDKVSGLLFGLRTFVAEIW